MIKHTNAFKRLKDGVQAAFDFAIVVCYAAPSLKKALRDIGQEQPLPFTPDYFDSRPIPTEKVRIHLGTYKENLSRHLFLSSFSYFEAYIVDVLKEILDFHGRESLLKKHALDRNASLAGGAEKARRKLQEYPTAKSRDAYKSYGKHLALQGFVFPSSVLAKRGLQKLIEQVDGEYIRAADLPEFIESVLQLVLSDDEKQRFHAYRDMRNKIAHGRPDALSLHLKKAVEANNFLRNLAIKVDNHVVRNLMLVEL